MSSLYKECSLLLKHRPLCRFNLKEIRPHPVTTEARDRHTWYSCCARQSKWPCRGAVSSCSDQKSTSVRWVGSLSHRVLSLVGSWDYLQGEGWRGGQWLNSDSKEFVTGWSKHSEVGSVGKTSGDFQATLRFSENINRCTKCKQQQCACRLRLGECIRPQLQPQGSAGGSLTVIFLPTSHSVVAVSAHLRNASRGVLLGLRFTMLETNYFLTPSSATLPYPALSLHLQV